MSGYLERLVTRLGVTTGAPVQDSAPDFALPAPQPLTVVDPFEDAVLEEATPASADTSSPDAQITAEPPVQPVNSISPVPELDEEMEHPAPQAADLLMPAPVERNEPDSPPVEANPDDAIQPPPVLPEIVPVVETQVRREIIHTEHTVYVEANRTESAETDIEPEPVATFEPHEEDTPEMAAPETLERPPLPAPEPEAETDDLPIVEPRLSPPVEPSLSDPPPQVTIGEIVVEIVNKPQPRPAPVPAASQRAPAPPPMPRPGVRSKSSYGIGQS